MSELKRISTLIGLVLLSATAAAEIVNNELLTGSVIGKHIFGLSRDFQGDPVMLAEDPLIYQEETRSHDLIVGQNRFRISLFDHQIAGVYVGEYFNGSDKLGDSYALPMGAMGGVHTIGSSLKSDWNTVLFTENGFVNANDFVEFAKRQAPYFKNKLDLVNPYNYGWLNEVITLDELGASKAIKNFASGRLFADSMIALPDGKTFYFYDGDFSGNLYLFIASERNSFAKGTLYVVGNDASVSELGKSSALKMKFKLKRADFNDFYKSAELINGQCTKGYKFVVSAYGSECLKPVKKNRKYVGQFEPVRQSSILGVVPFQKSGGEVKYDGNNNVILIKENGSVSRRLKLKIDQQLGTQYLVSNEV